MTSTAILLALSLSAAEGDRGPDLVGAEDLYYQARYGQALRALGDNCADSEDAVRCERLRAYILMAQGDEAGAKEAFNRMLAVDPEASVGEEAPPKLRALFDEAKNDAVDPSSLVLSPVVLESEDAPWRLELITPEGINLLSARVDIAPHGTKDYVEVPLERRQRAWVGTFTPERGEPGLATYMLALTLADGRSVTLGTPSTPKSVYVGTSDAHTEVAGTPGLEAPKVEPPGGESLPKWAIWTMVGGGAAIVVGATIAAIVAATSKDAPGTIAVSIEFEDLP